MTITAEQQRRANAFARQHGHGRATTVIIGETNRIVSLVAYGYRKKTTDQYVPNAYMNNFGWKNCYYQAAETVVEITPAAGWKVGDKYYAASGEMSGRPWDLAERGVECRTRAEAQRNADDWFDSLTPNERKYANVYVIRWQIDAVEDDGTIAAGHTFNP